jgi:hypothetical protein
MAGKAGKTRSKTNDHVREEYSKIYFMLVHTCTAACGLLLRRILAQATQRIADPYRKTCIRINTVTILPSFSCATFFPAEPCMAVHCALASHILD